MNSTGRQLLSGASASALAALHGGAALGAGYPGAPSTEILEYFPHIGGKTSGRRTKKLYLKPASAWPAAAHVCSLR
jgi:TPP-dependent indolepyruvate ferredoxin oxidoreductase alpha subunit